MSRVALMDKGGKYTGRYANKLPAHVKGLLHSGFLILVVDRKGIVVGKRASTKHCWPDFWDGTIASHLIERGDGPSVRKSVVERAEKELGVRGFELDFFDRADFYYRAKCPRTGLYEHEWCDFGLAFYDGVIGDPLNDEISVVRHIDSYARLRSFADCESVTPWFIIAMARMDCDAERLARLMCLCPCLRW